MKRRRGNDRVPNNSISLNFTCASAPNEPKMKSYSRVNLSSGRQVSVEILLSFDRRRIPLSSREKFESVSIQPCAWKRIVNLGPTVKTECNTTVLKFTALEPSLPRYRGFPRRAESRRGERKKHGRCVRRASFAQLLCAAEDKQRLARSSLKSWEGKKKKSWKKRNNRRIESPCFHPASPRFHPLHPRKNEWRGTWWRLEKLRNGCKRKISTRTYFSPRFLFRPLIADACERIRIAKRIRVERDAIFFPVENREIPFHGG